MERLRIPRIVGQFLQFRSGLLPEKCAQSTRSATSEPSDPEHRAFRARAGHQESWAGVPQNVSRRYVTQRTSGYACRSEFVRRQCENRDGSLFHAHLIKQPLRLVNFARDPQDVADVDTN